MDTSEDKGIQIKKISNSSCNLQMYFYSINFQW